MRARPRRARARRGSRDRDPALVELGVVAHPVRIAGAAGSRRAARRRPGPGTLVEARVAAPGTPGARLVEERVGRPTDGDRRSASLTASSVAAASAATRNATGSCASDPIFAPAGRVGTPRKASLGAGASGLVSAVTRGTAYIDAVVVATAAGRPCAAAWSRWRSPRRGVTGRRQRLARRLAAPSRPAGGDRPLPRNGGFSYGCNLGAARGHAPFLLFLNPDARIGAAAVGALREALEAHPAAALVGPRSWRTAGTVAWSQRRFPRRRSTFAQALFLHRLRPRAAWTDELIRDPAAYEVPATPDWISGACMLVRPTPPRRSAGSTRASSSTARTPTCAGAFGTRATGFATSLPRSAPCGRRLLGAGRHPGDRRAQPRALRAQAPPGGARRMEALGVALGEATHAGGGADPAVLAPRTRGGAPRGARACSAAEPCGSSRLGRLRTVRLDRLAAPAPEAGAGPRPPR